MWNRIANFILKNRFFVLGLITLVTVYMGYYAATGLRMENKYGIVLPKDSPTTQNYNLFKERFGEDGSTLVIAIKDKDLFTKKKFNLFLGVKSRSKIIEQKNAILRRFFQSIILLL